MPPPEPITRIPMGTPSGEFDVHAFRGPTSGDIHLALVRGELGDGASVLARLHSECLTGDALGSLRCDCGVQLRTAVREIGAEGRGVLVYATGHEGRGIGLVNKLLAYALQQEGADTVEANEMLGLPVDGRDFTEPAEVLRALGVRSVRLLTNNPEKVAAVRRVGIEVEDVVPLPTVAHVRNSAYLDAKRRRLGHTAPTGVPPTPLGEPPDVHEVLGVVREHGLRPHVIVKYAQTLDGRIATETGDSKWISGEEERRLSHAFRAACDAVLVGLGTVLRDDPQLTVRVVPGASPMRVVLDSTLLTPPTARVLSADAATVILTTTRSNPGRRAALRERGVAVRVVDEGPNGVDLEAALHTLTAMGIRSLLVEGGARVITSFLDRGMADRVVVGVAPTILGSGTEAVGDLGIQRIADAVRLEGATTYAIGGDVVIAGDVMRVPGRAARPAQLGRAAGC